MVQPLGVKQHHESFSHHSFWWRMWCCRAAILNCVLPAWILPMSARQEGAEKFRYSEARSKLLTPREVRDVERMCNFSFYGEQQQYKRDPFNENAPAKL